MGFLRDLVFVTWVGVLLVEKFRIAG